MSEIETDKISSSRLINRFNGKDHFSLFKMNVTVYFRSIGLEDLLTTKPDHYKPSRASIGGRDEPTYGDDRDDDERGEKEKKSGSSKEEKKKTAIARDCKGFMILFAALVVDVQEIFKTVEPGNTYLLWKAICERYDSKTETDINYVREQLASVKLGANEDIDAYMSRINAMVVRLREVNTYTDDGQIKFHLIRGLPDSYERVVEIIDIQKSLSLAEVVGILRRHQQKMNEQKKVIAEKEKAIAILFLRHVEMSNVKFC